MAAGRAMPVGLMRYARLLIPLFLFSSPLWAEETIFDRLAKAASNPRLARLLERGERLAKRAEGSRGLGVKLSKAIATLNPSFWKATPFILWAEDASAVVFVHRTTYSLAVSVVTLRIDGVASKKRPTEAHPALADLLGGVLKAVADSQAGPWPIDTIRINAMTVGNPHLHRLLPEIGFQSLGASGRCTNLLLGSALFVGLTYLPDFPYRFLANAPIGWAAGLKLGRGIFNSYSYTLVVSAH